MLMLAPVVRELRRRGHEVVLLGLTLGGPTAEKAGLSPRGYRHYLDLAGSPAVEAAGRRLAGQMHDDKFGIPLEESIAYLGINYAELVETYGSAIAEELFERGGRHAFLPVRFFRALIEREQPDLVLTTNSPRSEKAALIAARELGVAAIRLEDLFLETHSVERIRAGMGGELFDRTIGRYDVRPDRLCVMCEYTKRVLPERAAAHRLVVPLEQVVVTGQPAFDAMDAVMAMPPAPLPFAGRESIPAVVWAQQNGTPDEAEVLDLLAEWRRRVSDDELTFVIKAHPTTSDQQLRAILSRFDKRRPDLRVIQSEMDPNSLIWSSRVVVGQFSTMLTQAAYMQRPVLILDPLGMRRENAFLETGIGRAVRDAEELDRACRELLDSSGALQASLARKFEQIGFRREGTQHVVRDIEGLLSAATGGREAA